jgi:hypothetical protein
LCNPELANTVYRNIAEAADVAHGAVGWIMTDLKEAGILVDLGKGGRKLVNRSKLLDQWVEGYARQLRPKLMIGRFRALGPERMKEGQLTVQGAQWGGETAAAKLTGDLKPAVTTFYPPKDAKAQADLMKEFRLVKDAAGEMDPKPTDLQFIRQFGGEILMEAGKPDPVFMAGAMARDLILTYGYEINTGRRTEDIDWAMSVESFLVSAGFP